MNLRCNSNMDFNKQQIVISPFDYKTNLGETLIVTQTFDSVSNGDTVYVRHVSGANRALKSVVSIETVGQWEFASYAGTTYTDDGTVLTQINRTAGSTYVPEVIFYSNPTIETLGTTRLQFTFGVGTNPSRSSSGNFIDGTESVFPPTTDVLVGLTNNSGSTQYVTIRYDFYEE